MVSGGSAARALQVFEGAIGAWEDLLKEFGINVPAPRIATGSLPLLARSDQPRKPATKLPYSSAIGRSRSTLIRRRVAVTAPALAESPPWLRGWSGPGTW
jgi:hypothetical protein